jgi:predicted phosphohydrolase
VRVFAISDPHLALGRPDKSMRVFGEVWATHPDAMAERWRARVGEDDLVVVAGDISWAMRLDQAAADLEFLAALPGRKVMVRGNHDYWWSAISKVRAALPAGMMVVHNDAVSIDGVAVGGVRLWDDPEVDLSGLEWRAGYWDDTDELVAEDPVRTEKLLARDLGRLERSLAGLDPDAVLRIAAVHYPPVGPGLEPTRASAVLTAAGVHHCVFGHLHGVDPARHDPCLGELDGVRYWLTSCDFLDFDPVQIAAV